MNRLQHTSGIPMAMLELVKIGLGLYGVFLIIVYGSRGYEAHSSQYWPTTTGEITRSAVDVSGGFDGNRRYRSNIKYSYTVGLSGNEEPEADDATFVSQRVRLEPMPSMASFALAEAGLVPYPKGSSVDVYYNPSRPERSLLEPNFSLGYLLRPLIGLLCLGAAISLRKVGRGG